MPLGMGVSEYNDKEVILHILSDSEENNFEKGYVENIFEIAYNKYIRKIIPEEKSSELLYKELSEKYDKLSKRCNELSDRIRILEK